MLQILEKLEGKLQRSVEVFPENFSAFQNLFPDKPKEYLEQIVNDVLAKELDYLKNGVNNPDWFSAEDCCPEHKETS